MSSGFMMPVNALLAILASMLAAMLAVEAVAAVGEADLQLLWSLSEAMTCPAPAGILAFNDNEY